MSTHKVEVVNIAEIAEHDNADALELCRVTEGWWVVTRKDTHKVGDKVIYVPTNSVLTDEKLEILLFPPDSKITLSKHRIKAIRIRGKISEGMIIPFEEELLREYPKLKNSKVGDDVSSILGIVKYEPPAADLPGAMKGKQARKNNPNFTKYTDIENIKWFPNSFKEGDLCYISFKMHGTSARFGLVPTHTNTLWRKFLKFIRVLPAYEFVWGSRNVQLDNKFSRRGWYKKDIYTDVAQRYKDVVFENEVVYGEIVGWAGDSAIQKNYTFGHKKGECSFFAYDVKKNGKYLDYEEFVNYCDSRGIPRVPELYVGLYSRDRVDSLVKGKDQWGQIREGVVVKGLTEEAYPGLGRKVLKVINDEYLLKDNTEFH